MQKNNDAKKAENLTPGKLDRFRARQWERVNAFLLMEAISSIGVLS